VAAAAHAANFVNGQAARAEFGQVSFTYGASGAQQNILGGASGIAYSNGILFVSDANRVGATPINNRVMMFDATQVPDRRQDVTTANHASGSCWLCGYSAIGLIGQIDYGSSTAGRNSVPTSSSSGNVGSLSSPTAVATDGRILAIADTDNNRVLIWTAIPSSQTTPPNIVLGQKDFTSFQSPQPVNANSLRGPQGVWIQNGRLYVADTQNYRVLVWNSIPTSNNQPADLVLGQANFTSVSSPPVTNADPVAAADRMLNPVSVTSDGTRLFVADLGFNRVLIWNSIPTSMDQAADVVIGQPDMTSSKANNNTATCAATGTDSSGNATYPTICGATLNFPRFALSDGTRLFVADGGNNRVLIFNNIPTSNAARADTVLGQPDFTTDIVTNQAFNFASTAIDNTGAVDTIPTPTSLAYDGLNLYVSDPYNRRVLMFTPGDTPLPNNSVVNWASEIIRQEGVVVLSGNPVANDTVTVTIAGTGHTYTVKTGDTLDKVAQGVVNQINSDNDVNVTALFGGAGRGSIYLSSRATNLGFDALSLAASTSNTANMTATTSGGYLSAGSGATAAPGMWVEINGTNLADQTVTVPNPVSGNLPITLGGVNVYMDGIFASLMSVSPTQIIAQVPFWFQDRNSMSVYVRTTHASGDTTVTNTTPVYIAPANPGLFNAPAFAGQPRPWPALNARHQGGNPTAVVSIDGSITAGNTATITIAGTAYTYTVQSSDTLSSVVNGLINLINASDQNVTASVGPAFNRVVLTAKQGGGAGTGISVAGSTSSNATLTVTPYTNATCCNVVSGSVITPDNPAVPGELISVMATGLGVLSDPNAQAAAQAGQPYNGPVPNTASNSINGTMNNATAQVVSGGFAQGSYGIYQIQMIVPSDLPSNPNTQLYVAQNAFISNIVTLPVGSAVAAVPPGAGIASGQALVSPVSLTFATQTFGSTAVSTQTVTVSNPGTTALSITSISLAGANAGDFTISNGCGTSVPPGGNCTVNVSYSPTSSGGVQNASLVISTSSASSPNTVRLIGIAGSVFQISNKLSGKVLDVANRSTGNGALIQQYDFNGGSNQQWTFAPVGNGSYAIVNVGSGKALDVAGASLQSGTPIQQFDYLGGANQQWNLVATPDGYLEIVNVLSGKALDVTGQSLAAGAPIQQYDYMNGDNQKWSLGPVQSYVISNVNSGKVLDVVNTSRDNGALIQQYDYMAGGNQQWILLPIDATYYRIINVLSGKALDIKDMSNADGASIQQYDYLGGGNQQWALVPAGNGAFSIVNKKSGRVLDVTDGSKQNQALIQQFDYVGGANQQWNVTPVVPNQ
jgi:uncharacterized protein (TIGR03437 family)